MAKNSIRDYSATNSSNTDIQSIDISEGCSPAGINNAIREVMADLKDVSVGTVALESPEADSLTVTGDLTVDTSTLYVDSTNNRVGIANASPSVELDVTGAAKVSGDLTVDTDTLYVDSTNNNVGVGTTSPSGKLDVEDTSGSLSATKDITAEFRREDGTYNPRLQIRHSTTGSDIHNTWSTTASNLTFSNGSTESMRIDSSGRVLIATTTSGGDGYTFDNNGFFTHARASGAAQSMVGFKNGGSFVGEIRTSTTATSYITSSDYRLKENVTATWDATTRLKQLNPVRFNFIADADTTVDGFLAHEVQSVVPEAVTGTHDEVDDDGNPVYQGIDQSKLVPLLVKTIQELEARVAALENA